VLARHPEKITVGDIVRALEGPIAPVDCVSEYEPTECDEADYCISRNVWIKVRDKLAEVLDSISLADMCRDAQKAQKNKGYYMYYI
jgi:Rrf2 family protein